MTLAGGCGQKTLVRAGGGNLKSIVVFIFLGYASLVTLRGILGAFRVNYLQAEAVTIHLDGIQTLPTLLSLDQTAALGLAFAIATALLVFIFANRDFRANYDGILSGVVVGLVVAAGWYVTGKMGFGEDQDTLEMVYLGTNSHLAESMTFVAPIGYTMEYWALWTDASTVLTFGIGSVFGVSVGSFAYAVLHKTFRWEFFTSPQDLMRHIFGAVLMGFGGVVAIGCTIGQGVTGVSTLSIMSFLVLVSIIVGGAATMKIQYAIMMRDG
jgi:uncharacterized membrane protein YedE/YeeE